MGDDVQIDYSHKTRICNYSSWLNEQPSGLKEQIMWDKLIKKKNSSEKARTLEALADARNRGDGRAEIAVSMVFIGEEVQLIQEALTRIEDLYSERLDDLLENDSSYFPVDVAVAVKDIDGYVYEVRERTDLLFDRLTSLMRAMTAVIKK